MTDQALHLCRVFGLSLWLREQLRVYPEDNCGRQRFDVIFFRNLLGDLDLRREINWLSVR